MNKKVPTLNVPALWTPIPDTKMNKRTYKASLPYDEDGQIKIATEDKPIHRYAKNFTKDGIRFSICLFSDISSQAEISKFFKGVVEKLDRQTIGKALMTASSSNFTYLNNRYGDK